MTAIDVHAHIYPEKIAERAVGAVGEFYLVDMYGQGTASHLLAAKDRAPLTHFVVHSVATKPSAVASINDFIAEQCRLHPELIGFMAMHQDLEDPEVEIERAVGLGLRGMKLHPDTQKVNMDDPRLMSIYEMIAGRLPLIVHTGDYRTDFSHPRRLKNILHTSPTSWWTPPTSAAGPSPRSATTCCTTRTCSSTCPALWPSSATGAPASS